MCVCGEDSHCCHRRVAAITVDGVVDDAIDNAPGSVYYARCRTDGENRQENAALQTIGALGEMYFAFAAYEMTHHKQSGYKHGDIGGNGGTLYAPVKSEYEYGSENQVKSCTYEHRHHSLGGISGGAHHVAVGITQVVHQKTRQEVEHKVVSIGKGNVAGAEKTENWVEKKPKHPYVERAEHKCHHYAVAKHQLSLRAVAHTKHNGSPRTCTGTDKNTESRTDIHHRESDGKSGNSIGSHTMTYENTIYNIVNGHDHDAHYSRQAIFPEKLPHRGFVEFTESVHCTRNLQPQI